jgi:hypothetical protein
MELRDDRTGADFPRMRSPLVAWTLIAAILIGGLPILTGVVVVADSKPAFTLEICHPIGSASHNFDQGEAPVIPTHDGAQLPRESGAAPEPIAAFCPRMSTSPDPLPPKIGT